MSTQPERDINKELQETIAVLPTVDTFPFQSSLNHEYTAEHLLLSQTGANILFALNKARRARELAVSYRNFDVGASIMGLSASPSRLRYLTGVNIKPEEGSVVNVHAEQLALHKLEKDGFDMVSMVVVVGETQPDQQSGKDMHTLHPCGLCRGILLQSNIVDPDLTMIVCAVPDFTTIEITSLNGLRTYHENGDDSGITRFEFDSDMEMLSPPPEGPVHLIDTPKSIEEQRKWDEIIGIALAERMVKALGSAANSE